MTPGQRRVHLGMIVLLTAVLVSTLAVQLPRRPAADPAPQPSATGSLIAAWAVGPDSLLLFDEGTGDIRFRAPSGARWPAARISWTSAAGDVTTDLGPVAAGHDLVITFERRPGGGTVTLRSVAWDSVLGSWTVP